MAQTPVRTIRMVDETYQKLRDVAEERCMSFSELMVHIATWYLNMEDECESR